MSREKAQANQTLTDALDWWRDHASALSADLVSTPGRASEAPVTIMWKAPRYRVRLGPFASRSEAEDVLAAVESTFPEAFIAPERLESGP